MARRPPIPRDAYEFDGPPSDAYIEDIRGLDPARVTGALAELVKESEAMRLRYMKTMQKRRFMTMTFGLLCGLGGACAFGWYFLVQYNLPMALLSLGPAFALPVVMSFWSGLPAKAYKRDFKKKFMPELAHALGGFKFNAERGVGEKIIGQTAIVPAYDRYNAEDCFIGIYKGVKVIFSEVQLRNRKLKEPAFQGMFVLLQTPQEVFEGHTIITADRKMAERYALTRWKKLSPVKISPAHPSWDRFVVYSNKPDVAQMLCGDKLLKELSEACDAFGGVPASAVFFGGKYVFLMIPEGDDMFEASDIYAPVTVHSYAEKFQREVIRVLEIIDIFDIYRS